MSPPNDNKEIHACSIMFTCQASEKKMQEKTILRDATCKSTLKL